MTATHAGDALDRIEFLAGSPWRLDLLGVLVESGPLTGRELRSRLGASRTTVNRNLDALCNHGFVTNSGDEYAITPVGGAIATDCFDLAETIDLTNRLEPFLEWVPDGALDLDLRHLADAEVLVAEPGDPWAMINRHVECIKSMDRSRSFLPFTGLHAMEAAHEQVVNHGARCELVVTPEIADVHLADPAYAELAEEMVETGRVEYFRYDGDLPYGLNVIDDAVQIVVADGDQPRAMVESNDEAVREWAEVDTPSTNDDPNRSRSPVRTDDSPAVRRSGSVLGRPRLHHYRSGTERCALPAHCAADTLITRSPVVLSQGGGLDPCHLMLARGPRTRTRMGGRGTCSARPGYR